VLRILADGHGHSGEHLAQALGVTRGAVKKQLAELEAWGLDVEVTPQSDYLLDRPIDLLDKALILDELNPDVERLVARLDVHEEIDSTNQALLDAAPHAAGKLVIALAEYQSAGRGRRGRSWVAPFGGGLCFSAGWLFDEMPRDLAAMTLATGVVVRRVLLDETGLDIRLKWPNDLVWEDKKLGGILVELAAESQGPCYVVIGIGINISIAPGRLEQVAGWPSGAVDLHTATAGRPPSRNVLAARLIEASARLLPHYGDHGFVRYHAEFTGVDYLRGRHVSVDAVTEPVSGVAAGVDRSGALLVDTGDGIRRVISGDISVRTRA
jgi:BirA family biotin operon repressor/biotin-[acetyl-CoA-carboxylase] ligase